MDTCHAGIFGKMLGHFAEGPSQGPKGHLASAATLARARPACEVDYCLGSSIIAMVLPEIRNLTIERHCHTGGLPAWRGCHLHDSNATEPRKMLVAGRLGLVACRRTRCYDCEVVLLVLVIVRALRRPKPLYIQPPGMSHAHHFRHLSHHHDGDFWVSSDAHI
jgi:hypothetical protein